MVHLLKTPVIYLINNKFRGINLSVLNYCSNFATLFGVTAVVWAEVLSKSMLRWNDKQFLILYKKWI